MKNLKKLLRSTGLLLLLVCYSGLLPGQRYFSYIPEGKAYYELSTEKILLRFAPNFTDGARTLLFRQHKMLKPYQADLVLDTPKVYFAELQAKTSFAQVEKLIRTLRSTPGIALASPFLRYQGQTEISFTESFQIGLKNSADLSLLRKYAERYHLEIVAQDKYTPTIYHLKVTDQTPLNTLDLTNQLSESKDFTFVEPDFLMLNLQRSNDPLFEAQWALSNTGQFEGSISGEDIDVERAWQITRGSKNINIAIIDDGVQSDHPDLQSNFLHGTDITGQAPGTGGYPGQFDGHGTACAGLAAATANNGTGIAGIANGCTITSVRISYKTAAGNSVYQNSWSAEGINSAWSEGQADVLSNSWGGGPPSSLVNSAIRNALQQGRNGKGSPVLFAAGNEGNNYVSYPAANPDCIAVGASTFCARRKSYNSCDGEDWWSSNVGNDLDIVAPGVAAITTDRTGQYGYTNSDYYYFGGTSAACPIAAGVMALVLSVNPDLTAQDARYILEASCEKIGNYNYSNISGHPVSAWNVEMGYGRVNAYRAIQMAAGVEEGMGELTLIDPVEITPDPIACGEEFSVYFNVYNSGTSTFSGAIGALLLDEDRKVLNLIGEFSEDGLEPDYYYVNGLEFTNPDLLLDEGEYYVAPVFATPGSESIFPVSPGEYENLIPVSVVCPTDLPKLVLASPIQINPNPAVSGQTIEVVYTVRNTGSTTWKGDLSADWLNQDEQFLKTVEEKYDISICAGCERTFTFSNSVALEPGYYYLAAYFYSPENNEEDFWYYIENGYYENPVPLDIIKEEEEELSLNKSVLNFSENGGNQSFSITSNLNWSASDDRSWIKLSATSGSGNKTITVTCDPNPETQTRSGKVTVTGGAIVRTLTVTQSGAALELSVDKEELSYVASGGNQSISISANTDWSASDDRSWIKLSATSGSGNKTITVTCDPNLDTQARSGKMTVSGGGISLTITVTQSAQTTTSPWTITETGENHTIVIRKDFMATIDGMPISSGDLVGFFYERDGTLFCSNYFIWTGKATSVAVYGNEAETSLKEGFDTGERFRIRIYRAATEEVFEANPQFAPQGTDGIVTHRDTYAKDGLSMLLNVSAKSIAMQEIDLQTGWNMISSYIVPQDRNMLQVLAPIADRTALIKNGKGQSTLPTLGINSIGDWQIVEGYKIKATQNTTLRLEGQRIEAADTPIPLQEGWQIIAFLKDSPASIESQLNSIRDIIEVVKDNKGNTFLPEYDINNIGEMEPGQGYQIRVSQSGVLVYDSDSQPKHGPDFPYAVLTPTTHFQLGDQFNTGNNATVIFPVNTLEKHLSIGDEIGVFTAGGVLCGAGVVADDNLAITVWGDDASTEIIEGMQPGEAYAFRSWHADSEEENQLGASFASGDGIYQEDDVEIVAALDILNGLFGRTTEVSALKVYPNPATASVWVKLPEGVKTLSLYNSLGQLIKQEPVEWCKADYPVDVSRMPAGTYQLRLQAGKRIWTARVIVE